MKNIEVVFLMILIISISCKKEPNPPSVPSETKNPCEMTHFGEFQLHNNSASHLLQWRCNGIPVTETGGTNAWIGWPRELRGGSYDGPFRFQCGTFWFCGRFATDYLNGQYTWSNWDSCQVTVLECSVIGRDVHLVNNKIVITDFGYLPK